MFLWVYLWWGWGVGLHVHVMSMQGPRVDAAVNVKRFINCSVTFVHEGGFHAFRLKVRS